MSNAKINLTPNCVLEINHPLDGAAYALSYALQKRIDAMSGGEKPNILFDGHHHIKQFIYFTGTYMPLKQGHSKAKHLGCGANGFLRIWADGYIKYM